MTKNNQSDFGHIFMLPSYGAVQWSCQGMQPWMFKKVSCRCWKPRWPVYNPTWRRSQGVESRPVLQSDPQEKLMDATHADINMGSFIEKLITCETARIQTWEIRQDVKGCYENAEKKFDNDLLFKLGPGPGIINFPTTTIDIWWYQSKSWTPDWKWVKVCINLLNSYFLSPWWTFEIELCPTGCRFTICFASFCFGSNQISGNWNTSETVQT